MHRKNTTWKIAAYLVMICFSVLTLGPLIWLLYSSVKPHADIVRNVFALPKVFHFKSYTQAWTLGRLGVLMLNSVFYSAVATAVTTLLALAAGYGFAKFNYRITGFFTSSL